MLTGTCHCGQARWTLKGDPGTVTACNCTLCRRYWTLWPYDYEAERISLHGLTSSYRRQDQENPGLEIVFCPTCAGILAWRGLRLHPGGRRRMAVNMRLAPPDAVADLPLRHFDGLGAFQDLPSSGKRVRDLWA